MNAIIVSCFGFYEERLRFIEEYLEQEGYKVKVLLSDFDHVKKDRVKDKYENISYIRTMEYKKNLSVKRILSHYLFAKDVLKEVTLHKPDLLYVLVPPNFLTKFIGKYRKKNNTKLIFDIIDLWPESFPNSKLNTKWNVLFKYWGKLRDKYLKHADLIITECNLYQKVLENPLKGKNVQTLYLTRDNENRTIKYKYKPGKLNLAYIGQINHLIDIPLIAAILGRVNKVVPIKLHIIGDGNNRELFIKMMRECGIEIKYYGKLFDEDKKYKIFEKCDFGLNIMKSTVSVGLTRKSMEYFGAGLPIINNIKADTNDLVDQYNIGINVTNENLEDAVTKIINLEEAELLLMRNNVTEVFNKLFSHNVASNNIQEIFKKINL